MFCPQCGNQVGEKERFCGKCGTMLQEAAPQPQPEMQPQVEPQQESPYAARPWPEQNAQQQQYQQYQQQPTQPVYQQQYQYQQYQQAPVKPAVNPKTAGSLPIMYLGLAAASILTIILWFCKGLYVAAMGMKETGSFHEICTDGGEILTVLNVIFAIVLAVLFVWPVLSNSVTKRRRLIGTKILAILQTLAYAIVLIATEGQASGSYWGVTVSWGLTFVGWLHLLAMLAILVVPYIISSKTKKING